MNTAELRKIDMALADGSARIVGRVTLGDRWPDEPHAWVIEGLTAQKTLHVPVEMRPGWKRYCNAAAAIAGAAATLGSKGGRSGAGPAKARTHEQASAAGKAGALKRWGDPKA